MEGLISALEEYSKGTKSKWSIGFNGTFHYAIVGDFKEPLYDYSKNITVKYLEIKRTILTLFNYLGRDKK
jgi:hypothetical protein